MDHLLKTQGGRGGSFPDADCERIGMERQAPQRYQPRLKGRQQALALALLAALSDVDIAIGIVVSAVAAVIALRTLAAVVQVIRAG
jgi:hypothetical protein